MRAPKKAITKTDLILAALALGRSSLAQWARQHQYPITTVWQAAHGRRNGTKSREIRQKLEELINA